MEQDFFDLLNRFEKSCQVHLQDVDEGFGPLLGPATSLVLGRDSSTYPYLKTIVVVLLGIPSPRPTCQKEKALRHMEYVDLGSFWQMRGFLSRLPWNCDFRVSAQVVFLHGRGDTGHNMLPVVAALAACTTATKRWSMILSSSKTHRFCEPRMQPSPVVVKPPSL